LKKIPHSIEYTKYNSPSELNEIDQKLLALATEQLAHAYAPYSQFHVGAAALLYNGSITTGSNQENASYPLCMCGERVALYAASGMHPGVRIKAVAIIAQNQNKPIKEVVSPCGACRQVIGEYENRQKAPIKILLKADGDEVLVFDSIKDLLPFSFDDSYL
jgi:cytidine deaminase